MRKRAVLGETYHDRRPSYRDTVLTSPKNFVIALLALATLSLGVVAWQQNSRAQHAARASTSDNEDLLKQLATAQRYAADLEARLAALQATAPTAEASSSSSETAQGENAERRIGSERASAENNRRAEMAALLNDPEVVKLMTAQQKNQLDGRYAALFKQLALSPAQIDTLKNLLLEKQNAQRDVMMAARETGLNPRENRDELRKLVEQSNAETDAEILAVLGQEKFNQYKTYDVTGSQRALVEQIGRSLSYSATPLTDAQSQALVQIFAQNDAAKTADGPGGGGERFNRGVTITDAMIVQAKRILAPDQVKAIQEQQASQQAAAKLRDMMRNAGRNRGNP